MKSRKFSIPISSWVGGVLLVTLSLIYIGLDWAYAGRVFPGVAVGYTDLSGQTASQLQLTIGQLLKEAKKEKVTFQTNGFRRSYTLNELGIDFLPKETAQAVFDFGRRGDAIQNFYYRTQALVKGVNVPVRYQEQLNRLDQIYDLLQKAVNQSGVDGEIVIVKKQAQIKPAQVGVILDDQHLRRTLSRRLSLLEFGLVELPIKETFPRFTDEVNQSVVDKINKNIEDYMLRLRTDTLVLSSEQLWEWVEVIKQDDALVVRLRPDDLTHYVNGVKKTVDQPVQNAVWEMTGSKMTKFQPDQPGVDLPVEATVQLIQKNLLNDQRQLDLPARYTEPQVKLTDLNDLGVAVLVGRGESNFTGSPKNRRHNIKVGASKFDKVLIDPEENFSFNQILGEVTAETGYLPELVIKGDETTPEFGGGLCQVSTTAFRAALNSGYPILSRQNHSYRVSYYEPAGTDATVYQPYPDLKFLNDTPFSILIHTYVSGDNLYFDFYSTSGGKRVELEGPRIYNVTDPPPPVYVETSTLPEGEQKKIDTAHRGADTILYRHIYDASGREIKKDVFKSHYIPWPEKYLVGVKEAPKVETNLNNIPPETTTQENPPINTT